jgi:two-component system, response regulator PdtaR
VGKERSPCKPFTVLVVEDEFLIAMELVGILEEAGCIVIGPAPTIETALTLLERHQPDACVLDVNLRGTRSAPVATALKAQNVPFVLSSAYDQATLDQHAEFDGAANIGKPTSPGLLLTALAGIVDTEATG